MLNIEIKTAPGHLIRSDQSGDWRYTTKKILVSVVEDTYQPESELAIAIHELIEAWLCRRDGITDLEVVSFDDMYEDERKQGHHKESDEPGDDPRAPYREQHMAATYVERAVCSALDLSWLKHEQAVTDSAKAHPKNASPSSPHPQSEPDRPLEFSREDQPNNR